MFEENLDCVDQNNGSVTSEQDVNKKEINKLKEANYQLLKRLNTVERERLEEASAQNEKIISLHSQIVKLRSDNEKTAAIHQEFELELAKTRKNCRDLERALSLKDQQMKAISENRENTGELQTLVEKQARELEANQLAFSQKESGLLSQIQCLNHEVAVKHQQIACLEKEKESLISNLNEVCQRLRSTKDSTESLLADRTEIQAHMREKEREMKLVADENHKWKEEQDAVLFKIKRLEECFEAEREAHLESKYNAELVQLRLNETQSALDHNQMSLEDANQVIEIMTVRLKEAEVALEEEAKTARQYQSEIEKLKQTNADAKKKLCEELEQQKKINSELTNSLNESKNKATDLQREVNQIKKKSDLETTEHEELLREIQSVTETYFGQLTNSSRSSTPIPSNAKNCTETKSTRQLIDQLKTLIQNQGRRITEANEEINKLNSDLTKASKINQMKEQSEKDNQSSQNSSVSAAREMSHLRKRLSEMEKTIADLKLINQEYKRNIESDKQSSSSSVNAADFVKSIKKKREEPVVGNHLPISLNNTPNRQIKPRVENKDKIDQEKSPKKLPPQVNRKNKEDPHIGDAGFHNESPQMSWPQMKAELYDGVTHLVEMLLQRHQRENSVDINNSQIKMLNRTIPEKDLSKSKYNADKGYRYKNQATTNKQQEFNQQRPIPMDNNFQSKPRKMKQNLVIEDKTRACCCGDTERSSLSNSGHKCSSCLMSMN